MIEYEPKALTNAERTQFFFKHGITPEIADIYRAECLKAFNFLSLVLYEDYVDQDLVYDLVKNQQFYYNLTTLIDLTKNLDQLSFPRELKDSQVETICAYSMILINHLEAKHRLRFVSPFEDVDLSTNQ